jgi:hypothetical protein
MKIKNELQADFIEEISKWPGFKEVLGEEINEDLLISKKLRPGDSFSFYSLPLYVVCRLTRPRSVIETGTQNGGSTQAILYALHKNNFGTLYSIDSGDTSTDKSHSLTNGTPGQFVLSYLKSRWELTIGLSYDKLQGILDRISTVDLFFHDSDHSKGCVEFEFESVVKHCQKRSLVGLHDHYDQWDYRTILKGFQQVIGIKRPLVHSKDGVYHNVLRLWEKW